MNEKTKATRAIELTVELDADAQTVWEALTDARYLASWFPLYAESEAGEGASVTLAWGEGIEWTTRVSVWEPGEHLRWQDPPGENPDGEGAPISAVDFYLAGHERGVTLRLVNSGFGTDDEWDEQYEATKAGWAYFLHNLKHYLHHHPRRIREMVWAREKLPGERREIWARILASLGGELRPGSRVALELFEGDRCEGIVEIVAPGRTAALRIPELNEALLFIELEPGPRDLSCGIWLSTYGLESAPHCRRGIDAWMKDLAAT